MRKIIAFIGGGNMTNCLATALIKKGYPTDCIIVSSRDQTKLTDLTTRLSLKMAKTNSEAIADADIVILAVKPSVIKTVCEETAAAIAIKKPLIISLATGINVTSMATWLGNDKLGIVRTMSNTPTKVGLGMTVLFANEAVTEEQRKDIENIFDTVGKSSWVPKENDINLLTPPVGCGPAYFFLLVQAMQDAMIASGTPAELAKEAALQVFLGSAELAKQSKLPAEELRRAVTTPGGATEASVNSLINDGFFESVKKAFATGTTRCEEIEAAATAPKLT